MSNSKSETTSSAVTRRDFVRLAGGAADLELGLDLLAGGEPDGA